jgi:hypothetical protein
LEAPVYEICADAVGALLLAVVLSYIFGIWKAVDGCPRYAVLAISPDPLGTPLVHPGPCV